MSSTASPCVVFFLSTGRCGTQYFGERLEQNYDDLLRVAHEPCQEQYRPPHYLAEIHAGRDPVLSPELEAHFQGIEETLKTRSYIETGWPSYGLLPYLIQRFNGRIRIVHLYRHPVKVAASLTTHRVYNRGDWSREMSLRPDCPGVLQSQLAGRRWDKMDDFGKCLFWWTEINHLGLQLHRQFPELPWLSLRFESVFSEESEALHRELLAFLELPERNGFFQSTQNKVDHLSRKRKGPINIRQLRKYPEALKLMKELGYDPAEVKARDIHSRYVDSDPSSGWKRLDPRRLLRG